MRSIVVRSITEPKKALFYIYFHIAGLLHWRKHPVRVVGTPHTRIYLTWKIFRLLGIRETRDQALLTYFHNYHTTLDSAGDGINGKCTDISKTNVDKAFVDVFGYSTIVDPTSHVGPMVEKSEENATHDGRIIDGPIKMPAPGKIYQILIDNSLNTEEVEDLRPCIIGRRIVTVFRKVRPKSDRFSNENTRVTCCDPASVFSDDELSLIFQFCQRIGLDIGELDILRSRSDGRLYIVDVAKTPHSPSDNLVGIEGIRCMYRAAQVFREEFLT